MHRYTKPLLSLFLTFGMLALFVLSIHAQTLGFSETNPILLDADTHHLGDQTIEFFDISVPEGVVYSINFTLPASAIQDSYLLLETYNVEGVNLVKFNGQEIGFVPGTWWIGWQPVVLPVPGSVLMEGENTLTIISENFPSWRLFEHWYDDFMFRQL